ncbi:MAG: Rho termination factor N-terminal domain-containing protein, partial [Mycobacterium sp.]
MTDTDVFTAGENTDSNPVPAAVTTDTNDVKPAASGSLSGMVLPELRALANQVGVKGTSGMRK